jgi:hypothetical protein
MRNKFLCLYLPPRFFGPFSFYGVFEKLLKATIAPSCQSVCLSVHASVRPRGTTRLPLNEFS